MKWAVLLYLLAALTFSTPGYAVPATPGRVPAVLLFGRPYVQVTDWARAHGYAVSWLKRDETLQLVGSTSRIVMTVDSCDAQINGVQVRLLFALCKHGEAVYLSYLDAQTTLRPILYPPRNIPRRPIKTICLDPGHGGNEPGFHVGSRDEKTYTLLLAQEVKDQLSRAGFKVSLTRTRDTVVDLPVRPELANKREADLFISLHFNAAVGGSTATVRGVEVYCLTPAGAPSSNSQGVGAESGSFAGNANNDRNLWLAYELQRTLPRELQTEDRALRRARFAVLKDALMPAVLIESGYMSHPDEGRKIFDPTYRRQIARAIVQGVLAYKRTVER